MKLDRWARVVEIAANVAIVATLAFLVLEVRGNTRVLERQSILDRSNAIAMPLLISPQLPSILAKIKKTDGQHPTYQAFIDRYDLTPEESIQWERHLFLIWFGLEADFRNTGESPELEGAVRGLLAYPDNQIYWENLDWHLEPQFAEFVERVRGSGTAP